MISSTKRYSFALAVSLLGFVALLTWTTPASAAASGFTYRCSVSSATRQQCDFPVISAAFNSEIHYVTVQCDNSTAVAFNLRDVQISAIPPGGSGDVTFQMAGNRVSVGSVANAAAIVDVYVKINTAPTVLIDFSSAPSGTTICTASLTATY